VWSFLVGVCGHWLTLYLTSNCTHVSKPDLTGFLYTNYIPCQKFLMEEVSGSQWLHDVNSGRVMR
jgi:hypothetical protein